MSENVVQEIEVSMELLKKKIALAEVLNRLEQNKDFQEFILDGFCKEHALGLVSKRVSPAFQQEMNKKYIEDQLTAIGSLQLYMRFVKDEAKVSKKNLDEAIEERNRAMEKEVA